VPSGTYVVRIAASDAPSQATGSALVGELESAVVAEAMFLVELSTG